MHKKIKALANVVFFILVILGGWYWYKLVTTKGPASISDYTAFSQKIDEKINEELIALGVDDENVVKRYYQKKSRGKVSWLEITKEINVPDNCSLLTCNEMISKAVEAIGAEIYIADFSKDKDKLTINCGKDSIVLQKLILNQEKDLKAAVKKKYKIAIIIDDLGYNKSFLAKFIKLNIPMTFSILPKEAYSTFLAEEIIKTGNQVMIHLPLEPEGYPEKNPGPWACLISMSNQQIKEKVLSNLSSVPNAIGVNNHMGSKFMKNEDKLKVLLSTVKERKLFFLDSNTTKSSAGKICKEKGIKFIRNEVFLDNEDNLEYVKKQLQTAYKQALKQGSVVAIGHIQRKATPIALAELIPEFKKKGVEFIFVSDLVE